MAKFDVDVYEVVGKESVDYTNKDGKHIKGVNLYCVFDHTDIEGMGTENFYIPNTVDCSAISVGNKVSFFCNRFGTVRFVNKVS